MLRVKYVTVYMTNYLFSYIDNQWDRSRSPKMLSIVLVATYASGERASVMWLRMPAVGAYRKLWL